MKTGEIIAGLGLALGFGLLAGSRKGKRGASACRYPEPRPKKVEGVPFAKGVACPMWPLVTGRNPVVSYVDVDGTLHGNGARRFLAKRTSGEGDAKYHIGIDLYADVGDVVVATEAGHIESIRFFYHDAFAIYVCTRTGLTINYGEIKRNSWIEFGVSEGDKVSMGQPIARIGTMSGGSHMLHFETYKTCRDRNQRWYKGDPRPEDVRNPTDYLLRASMRLPNLNVA